MRVVVTGAAGFIGSHVAEALLERGDEVVGVDAFIPNYARAAKERNIAAALKHSSYRLVELDLRTDDLTSVLDQADAVINEAAMPGLLASWSNLELYAGCNLLALGRLVDACVERRIRRFIHVSTSSVYGAQAVGDESLPLHPVSPYGVTKLAGDLLLLANVHRFQFPAAIVRYFSVYGPRQRPDMGYHLFIEAMLDGREISVFGDGSQSRSVTFVSDCVAATLAALDSGRTGEIYNIGGGAEITVSEAISQIAAELGVEPRVRYEAERPGDQSRTRAETQKARIDFGYEPRVDPAAGLRAQVRWHIEQRANR